MKRIRSPVLSVLEHLSCVVGVFCVEDLCCVVGVFAGAS